jgi:2-polyprenyl-3-methyl-5-hydroxy-6-metoxy-1,4-benzoquinol methylase
MLFESSNCCPVCNTEAQFWCQAKDWEYGTSNNLYTYLQCIACKTLFIQNLPHVSLNEIYPENYYAFTKVSDNFLFRLKNKIDQTFYRKWLSKLPSANLFVLDVGGGTGSLLTSLKKIEKRIQYTEVVDINEQAMAAAIANGHSFTLSTIENYTSTKKFDVILLLNLIEHIPNPAEVLKKMEAWLSPNGIIIIKTPNADSWDAGLFRTTYWGGLHCPRHFIIFTKNSFLLMLKATGLVAEKISFTQGAPFWAYSVLHFFRKKDATINTTPLISYPLFSVLSMFFAVFDFCRSVFFKTSQMFVVVKRP